MTDDEKIGPTPGLFDARSLGYEQCVVAGDLVFVAGQAGPDERLQLVSPKFAPPGPSGAAQRPPRPRRRRHCAPAPAPLGPPFAAWPTTRH